MENQLGGEVLENLPERGGGGEEEEDREARGLLQRQDSNLLLDLEPNL